MNETAKGFLNAVRAKGSDARDVRDAAHEAFHAITAAKELAGRPWQREKIHEALVKHFSKKRRGDLWLHEIEARCVEQHVCLALDVDPGRELEQWIALSTMEAIRTRVEHADPVSSTRAAKLFFETERCREHVRKVLKLVPAVKLEV